MIMEKDMISHPEHYQADNGMEVIDVIEAFTANLKGIKATDTGNILKYACRWPSKGKPIEDLKKLIWYANHLVHHLEVEAQEKGANVVLDSTAIMCPGKIGE